MLQAIQAAAPFQKYSQLSPQKNNLPINTCRPNSVRFGMSTKPDRELLFEQIPHLHLAAGYTGAMTRSGFEEALGWDTLRVQEAWCDLAADQREQILLVAVGQGNATDDGFFDNIACACIPVAL